MYFRFALLALVAASTGAVAQTPIARSGQVEMKRGLAAPNNVGLWLTNHSRDHLSCTVSWDGLTAGISGTRRQQDSASIRLAPGETERVTTGVPVTDHERFSCGPDPLQAELRRRQEEEERARREAERREQLAREQAQQRRQEQAGREAQERQQQAALQARQQQEQQAYLQSLQRKQDEIHRENVRIAQQNAEYQRQVQAERERQQQLAAIRRQQEQAQRQQRYGAMQGALSAFARQMEERVAREEERERQEQMEQERESQRLALAAQQQEIERARQRQQQEMSRLRQQQQEALRQLGEERLRMQRDALALEPVVAAFRQRLTTQLDEHHQSTMRKADELRAQVEAVLQRVPSEQAIDGAEGIQKRPGFVPYRVNSQSFMLDYVGQVNPAGGLAHGLGRVDNTLNAGSVQSYAYAGTFENGAISGLGLVRVSHTNGNFSSWDGEMQNGAYGRLGRYVFTGSNGSSTYIGNPINGGLVLAKYASGAGYTGGMERMRRTGFGIELEPNGSVRRRGFWKEGSLMGPAEIVAAEGRWLCEARDGECSGVALWTWTSGNFRFGQRSGNQWTGPLYESGPGYIVYVDGPDGHGKVWWASGSTYEGSFRNGIYGEGPGRMVRADGTTEEGVFSGRKLVDGWTRTASGATSQVGAGTRVDMPVFQPPSASWRESLLQAARTQ